MNVFSNKDLLHDVGVAKRTIALKGVEQGTRGVSIRDEGYFETLGKVRKPPPIFSLTPS